MIDEPDINTITHEDDQFVYGVKTRSGEIVTEWVRWKGGPEVIGRPIPNLDPLDTTTARLEPGVMPPKYPYAVISEPYLSTPIPAAFDSSGSMILMPTVPTDQMIESAIEPYTAGISPELVDIFRKCVYQYYTRMVAAHIKAGE